MGKQRPSLHPCVPGDPLQVGEEGVAELRAKGVPDAEPECLEVEDVRVVEGGVVGQAPAESHVVRAPCLPRPLDSKSLPRDVSVPERQSGGCHAAKPAADDDGNLVRRLDDRRQITRGIENDLDSRVGEERLSAKHALRFRAAELGARISDVQRQERVDHPRPRRRVMEPDRARDVSPFCRMPGEGRPARPDVDARDDTAIARLDFHLGRLSAET